MAQIALMNTGRVFRCGLVGAAEVYYIERLAFGSRSRAITAITRDDGDCRRNQDAAQQVAVFPMRALGA